MAGTLYLVGTPIGNLGELSPRAAEVLAGVDFIAAEDTRVSVKLLNHLGLKKPLICYFEHNKAEMGEKIIRRLLSGESCALVTDAGMPAISDPGEELVRECARQQIPVSCAPGPTALITALCLSGLPTGRFCFEGFLSTTAKNRREHLDSLRTEQRTMIFYEAPHKLRRTLNDLAAVFGADRELTVCRELTKLHEEIVRTTLGSARERYAAETPRGEFVLVLRGAQPAAEPEASLEQALAQVERLRSEGKKLKDACRAVSAGTGWSKNALYTAALSAGESPARSGGGAE